MANNTPANNITPSQLLQMARLMKSKHAGQEAQQLETQLTQLAETGLNEEQQAQLHSAMQDKAKLGQLLNSPQAMALMKMMGGKQEKKP